jgi:high-affinity Fe2+/Pb2+ permease
MAFQDYFSVVAFFIFLRETLEASVIIAVLLQSMNRTAPRLKKQGEKTVVAAVATAAWYRLYSIFNVHWICIFGSS